MAKTRSSNRRASISKSEAAAREAPPAGEVVSHKNAVPQRFSLSLPPLQSEALNIMADATALSKNELMRNAIALLSVAHRARLKGLRLALVNDDDDVVAQIVPTV